MQAKVYKYIYFKVAGNFRFNMTNLQGLLIKL